MLQIPKIPRVVSLNFYSPVVIWKPLVNCQDAENGNHDSLSAREESWKTPNTVSKFILANDQSNTFLVSIIQCVQSRTSRTAPSLGTDT